MMECRQVLDRLSPFLDDELDPVTSREIADHVAHCEPCAAELARLRILREALRSGLAYHRAPAPLRERVRRDARRAVRVAPRTPRPALERWLALAASVLVVAGVAWLAVLPSAARRDATTREAIADHVRSLMASHLTDVASTDRHTVKPWFAGRLDYSPPVADFAAEGFPLIGGRLDVLGGRPVAALVYRRRQHVINAFVWPESHATALRATEERGWHVVSLARDGMAWRLVSDLNGDELSGFAQRLAAPPPP